MPESYPKVKCKHCGNKYGNSNIRKHEIACKRPVKYKSCANCGTPFPIGYKEQTTCSHACSNTYFRSGPGNGNWNRDQYTTTCFLYHKKKCVCCSEVRVVAVHHFDENRTNNDPRNLVPLCPTHHQYVHSGFANLVRSKIERYVTRFCKRNKYVRFK
jgi:hypothetical protein